MIVVHAGHRLDRNGQQQARFPAGRIGSVYRRSYLHLLERRPRAVVSAAANGADLLVLRAAEDLFIPFHIVLPIPVAEFRQRSVDDRGTEWSEAFDRATERAASLVTTDLLAHDNWYIRGNDFILDVAESTVPEAGQTDATKVGAIEAGAIEAGAIEALVVMCSQSRSGSATDDFANKAKQRGWAVYHIDPLLD